MGKTYNLRSKPYFGPCSPGSLVLRVKEAAKV